MKAHHVTARPNGVFDIAPLPLPTQQRKGPASPESYRLQASGEMPIGNYGPEPGDSLRSIVLSDGRFEGLATQPGSLLTFVISGNLTLRAGTSQCQLEPGDFFLTDERSSSNVVLDVRNQGRLVQIGVALDWPGPEAKIPEPGTITPSQDGTPNIKRIYTGENGKAYYTAFEEMFSGVANAWSAPRPILGFRMLCWEDGKMDYHPNVVNQLGIVSAGQLEIEVGGDSRKEIFRAGDICLTEDRTGEGHRNVTVGVTRVTTFVVPTEHLWPWPQKQ